MSYWAALIWAAFILLLCGIPGEDLPNVDFWEINIEDKLAHVFVFAILGILLVFGAWRFDNNKVNIRLVLVLISLGIMYGAITELLQGWLFPTRFMSLSDFIADSLGAILGTVFAFFFYRNRKG